MVAELLRNADMTVQIVTTVTMNTRSFLAKGVLQIFAPRRWAMPVVKSASPTMHIPATMTTVLPPKPE